LTSGEKGYVQFRCRWERAAAWTGTEVESLVAWRDRLHRLGLVGVYPDGVGFGNLSLRLLGGSFLVSGTGTGHLPSLGPEHFTEVVACDAAENFVHCRGPVQASSESLSHDAVYRSDPGVGAVVHVHHAALWERLRGRVPTTDPTAEAGTPEMARAIRALFRETDVRRTGLFVMGGHPEGLMAFGTTLDEAGERIVAAHRGLREREGA